MKNLTNRFVSFMLIFALALSLSVPAFAAECPSTNKSESGTTQAQATVTDDGIYINGHYYTKALFVSMLDSAENVQIFSDDESGEVMPASAVGAGAIGLGALAGTWVIPVLGTVVITAGGVILIKDVIVPAGTWAYNAVIQWFADRAEKEAYEKAKQKGTPTNNHSTQSGGSNLPTEGDPNSSKDHKVNGVVKQRRYYDADGHADMDIDYTHGGVGHTFPHRHYWVNGVRGKEVPF